MYIVFYEDPQGATAAKVTYLTATEFVDPAVASNGIEVATLPQQPSVAGKNAIMMIDLNTNTVFYDLVDRPLSLEEQVQELQAQNAQMLLALVTNNLI